MKKLAVIVLALVVQIGFLCLTMIHGFGLTIQNLWWIIVGFLGFTFGRMVPIISEENNE